MLLIPVFCSVGKDWMRLGLFLTNGGRSIWEIGAEATDKDIIDSLSKNDIPVLSLTRLSDVIYAKIDKKRLNLNDFYTWDEIDPKTSTLDVWRIISIPRGLWSCKIFREELWKNMGAIESRREGLELLLDKEG